MTRENSDRLATRDEIINKLGYMDRVIQIISSFEKKGGHITFEDSQTIACLVSLENAKTIDVIPSGTEQVSTVAAPKHFLDREELVKKLCLFAELIPEKGITVRANLAVADEKVLLKKKGKGPIDPEVQKHPRKPIIIEEQRKSQSHRRPFMCNRQRH